jgi:hypothetical protein
MDYAASMGDLRLGSAEHGWSGRFIDGSSGSPLAENLLTRTFARVTNGLVVMSCKGYAAGNAAQGSFIALCPGGAYSGMRSQWSATGTGWEFRGNAATATFTGAHDVTVNLMIYVDLDARKTWGTASWRDAVSPYSFHEFASPKCDWDSSAVGIDKVAVLADMRTANPGMDVDEIRVETIANYYEDFNEGAPGQSVTASPTRWTGAGPAGTDLCLGSGEHGWSGNYIDGSSASGAVENKYVRRITQALSGLVTMSCNAYAADAASQSSMVGMSASDTALTTNRCQWISQPDGWQFRAGQEYRGDYVDPHCGPFSSESFSGAIGTTVALKLFVDLDAKQTWGSADWVDPDGAAKSYTTAKYDWVTSEIRIGTVFVLMDKQNGWQGIDVDNLHVSSDHYFEDFDSGTSAGSVTLAPLGWTRQSPSGVLQLGSAQHGWSGNYIDGSSGTRGRVNAYGKEFPRVPHGLVELSCRAYAANPRSQGSCIGLMPSGAWGSKLNRWMSTPTGWEFKVQRGSGSDANLEAFAGGIGCSVDLRLFIDLETNRTWGQAKWKDGSGYHEYVTARYDWDETNAASRIGRVFVAMDRTKGRQGIDIDDLNVRVLPGEWRPHQVTRKGATDTRITAKYRILSEPWNVPNEAPYMVLMPADTGDTPPGSLKQDRVLLEVFLGPAMSSYVLTSDNEGDTWSKPAPVHVDAQGASDGGFGVSLTYMGRGELIMRNGAYDYSRDYGMTWGPGPTYPPASNGLQLYMWDKFVADRDGDAVTLTATQYNEVNLACQGYIMKSLDKGKTWLPEIQVPQWRGVSEVSPCRVSANVIVGGCRTDFPSWFTGVPGIEDVHPAGRIDIYTGLGVSRSTDNGLTWSPVSVLYDYGRHHASIVKLPDGTLVMTYAVRIANQANDPYRWPDTADGYPRFGVEAVVSTDAGVTWDVEHRYILYQYVGTRPFSDPGWFWNITQQVSTVVLANGDLLTTFGTWYRTSRDGSIPMRSPRDTGLIRWSLR